MTVVSGLTTSGAYSWPATPAAGSLGCALSAGSYTFYTNDDLYSAAIPAAVGINVLAGSLVVPAKAIGTNQTGAASSIARSHDNNLGWNNIETSAGVYNWAAMDAWVAAQGTQDIIYVVFGTPTFWTTSVDNSQSYGVGSLAFPDKAGGTAALTAFITALMTRYLGKIKYVEIWNEPKYATGGGSYFVGTATQLAQIAKLTYQAAKAVDPGVKILSTSPTGLEFAWVLNDLSGSDNLHKFLSASDGAAGFGKNWIDAIAVHTYSHNGYNNVFAMQQIANNVRAVLTANAMPTNTELWVTETSAITPTLASLSVESQKAYIARNLVLSLAAGFSRIVWYGLGGLGFTSPAVTAYWNSLVNLLQGATIGPVNYRTNGAAAGQVNLASASLGSTEGNVFATINGTRYVF